MLIGGAGRDAASSRAASSGPRAPVARLAAWPDHLPKSVSSVALRRALLTVVVTPFLVAIGMTLVDSYRRRGKRPKPFPTTPPRDVPVGDGEVTTYTFGRDLYDDMLAAIDGAQRQILFETYIWKGDEVGQRFKDALAAAADRGVEVYCIYDAFANLVVSPRFKRFPPTIKVLRYPVYAAGLAVLRPAPLRPRPPQDPRGRRRRSGSSAATTSATAYATEWRDTHVRITGPGVWDLKRAFADFWNLNRRRRIRSSERPLLLETASTWEPQIRFHRNVPRLWMFPIRGDVPRGDQPGQPQHLDDLRLLHPRPGLRRRA